MKRTLLITLLLVSGGTLRADEQTHVILPDDVIEMRVFQEDDLATRVRIGKDGNAILPLIESVHLAGKTVQEATKLISAKYKDGYLVNPQVSLIVAEYSKRMFTVLGQVQKPGSYDFPDNQGLDLLQALGIAGGYTRLADPTRVVLKRKGQRGEEVIKLDAKRMAKDHSTETYKVQPDDVITVGETLF